MTGRLENKGARRTRNRGFLSLPFFCRATLLLLVIAALDEPAEAAYGFELFQNQPNPFQTETSIGYRIPQSVEVQLEVYNLMGQRVYTLVDEKQPAGNYSVGWDGRDFRGRKLEGGVYLYWLKAGEFSSIRKLILIGL